MYVYIKLIIDADAFDPEGVKKKNIGFNLI